MKYFVKQTDPSKRSRLHQILIAIFVVVAVASFSISFQSTSTSGAPQMTLPEWSFVASLLLLMCLAIFAKPYQLAIIVLSNEQKELLRSVGIRALMTDADRRSITLPAKTVNGRKGTIRFAVDEFEYLLTEEAKDLLLADKLCVGYHNLAMYDFDEPPCVMQTYNLADLSVTF